MLNIEVLDDNSLQNILYNSNILSICFTQPPKQESIWQELNEKVFKIRKDIILELINIQKPWQDLSFLEALNEVEMLSITDMGILSVEPIINIKRLKKLILKVNSGVSLKPLEKFKDLEILTVGLSSIEIKVISEFEKLRELTLYYIDLDNLDFLKPLENLSEFRVYGGNITGMEILPGVGKITSMFLSELKTTQIDFIASMPYLTHLELIRFPLKKLPGFSESSQIESLELYGMNEIEDMMGIKNLKNLKKMTVYDTKKKSPTSVTVEKQKDELEKILNIEIFYTTEVD